MIATTLTTIAQLIVDALDRRGIDGKAVLRATGMDPAQLRDPNARYPFSAMTRLWHRASELSGDECFGLQVSRQLHPTSLHAIGFAWLASSSLVDALQRFERYCRVASTVINAELERDGSVYRLHIRYPQLHVQPATAAIDAAAATLIRLCRLGAGEQFRPIAVQLPRPQPSPACLAALVEWLRAPIRFDADHIVVEIAADTAEQTLASGNAELAHANERILIAYLARLDRSAFGARVKAYLVDALPSGQVSEEEAAHSLHVSARSLQRRLREEHTSFTRLLDDTRRELALAYLGDLQLSVNEISYLLGFSEASNFTRAFRRWTGQSPTAHRAQRQREDQSAAG